MVKWIRNWPYVTTWSIQHRFLWSLISVLIARTTDDIPCYLPITGEMLKFNLMKSYIYRWLYLSVFHIDFKNVWWKTLKICCLMTFTFTILYNKCNVLCKHQSLATCPQILQGLEFYLFYYCIKNVMFRVITWV